MGKWTQTDTEEAYGWTCTNCNVCQSCNSGCNVTCDNCQGCNSAQTFCATEQVASRRNIFSITLPAQYSNITPEIFNNLKTALTQIRNYGNAGTRNPDITGLDSYSVNQEIPAAAFNNIANKINYSNLVTATTSIISLSQFSALLEHLNGYRLNSNRCNTCNTAANITCTSCQGCNSTQACYQGCNQTCSNVTKWCPADYCQIECACGNCGNKEHGVWESLC